MKATGYSPAGSLFSRSSETQTREQRETPKRDPARSLWETLLELPNKCKIFCSDLTPSRFFVCLFLTLDLKLEARGTSAI